MSAAHGHGAPGSPLFANVTITIDGAAQPLTIVAINQGPLNYYVQSLTWNGAAVTGVTVPYSSLIQGGVLAFTMGPFPAARDAQVW